MGFEDWMGGVKASDYDDIICAMGDAFEAGQQSKQVEIDAIKNLIDEIVGVVREADLSDGDSSVAIVHDKIQELLK